MAKLIFRKTIKDSFNTTIIVMIIIQGILIYYQYCCYSENKALHSYLKNIPETNNPPPDSLACVTGDLVIVPNSKGTEGSNFEDVLEKDCNLSNIIEATGNWKYSVSRGKSSTTYTDKSLKIVHHFYLKSDRLEYHLKNRFGTYYSFRRKKFDSAGRLRNFSSRATWVDIEYFNPRKIYFIGNISEEKSGKRFVSNFSNWPVIISEVQISTILSGLFWACIFAALVTGYFFFSLFYRFNSSLKERFKANPGRYFIFDCTGSSESWAIFFFIVYIIFAIITHFSVDLYHSFYNDMKDSFLILALILLVHVSKSVEFFILADKKEGFLFKVDRGYFSQSISKMVPLVDVIPEVVEVRGSKNSIKYCLKANEIELTDNYNSPDFLYQVEEEYDSFILPEKEK